jgi:hypothetical protein
MDELSPEQIREIFREPPAPPGDRVSLNGNVNPRNRVSNLELELRQVSDGSPSPPQRNRSRHVNPLDDDVIANMPLHMNEDEIINFLTIN